MHDLYVHFQIGAGGLMPILGIFEQITEGLRAKEHKYSFG